MIPNESSAKVDGEKPMKPQSYTKNYSQLRMLSAGEIVFPRDEYTNGHLIPMTSPENIHTLYKLRRLYLGIYAYTCMYVCMYRFITVKKWDINLKAIKEVYMGELWKEREVKIS